MLYSPYLRKTKSIDSLNANKLVRHLFYRLFHKIIYQQSEIDCSRLIASSFTNQRNKGKQYYTNIHVKQQVNFLEK